MSEISRRRRLVVAVAGAVALVVMVVAAAMLVAHDEGADTDDMATDTTAHTDASTTTTRPATTGSTSTRPATSSPADTGSTTAGAATTIQPPANRTTGTGCVNGWIEPAPGTDLRVEPLDVIRRDMDISGQFHVIEMRYFRGPEVPWILAPRPPFVEWWYVKAQLVDDPGFRARWLVARRSPTIEGITAVARFNTAGYRSPDWLGFIGESEPHTIEGLPGTWMGMTFDFLVGEDGEKPGLPIEVVHCLDGT